MKIIFLFLILLSFGNSQIKITGTVIDNKSGSPIPLVNIYSSSLNEGEITDNKGKFSFTLNDEQKAELIFSHVAYENYHQIFDSTYNNVVIKLNETLIQLNNVVVTSTRSGYLLRDVPVATEVIGKKEITESGATTVNELLQQRAGVSTSTNVDGGAIFNMLGLDSRYILILKNGQPITGQFNNRVDLNHISTNRLKKIEIIKGPGSAVYGTDAMGGVLNIITEDAKNTLTLTTSYRASSFGSTPKQISKDPINSILKSSFTIPLKNFNFTSDITYQHFLK